MPNDIAQVDPAVLGVIADLDGQPPELVSRVQICLSEALYNLVLHSVGTDRSKPIELAVTQGQDDGSVGIEIYDPEGAETFDLRDHAPDLSSIDPLAESGRGLALIMECANTVDYGPKGSRFCLSLGFFRTDEAAGHFTTVENPETDNRT